MAKKPLKESAKAIAIPIKWMSEGAPSVFANQLVVQADEHEFHLSFFEIVPPFVLGDDQETRQKQVEQIGSVSAKCVVRVVISAERMEKFAEVMQVMVNKRKSAREGHRDTNGKE